MNILSEENKYVKLFVRCLLTLIVIGIISRTFNIISFLYYAVPVLLIISILFFLFFSAGKNKSLFYFLVIMLFPVYCTLTAAWSLTPFVSLQRGLYLLLMYAGLFSSVFLYTHFFYNKTALVVFLPSNILIVILSLLSLVSEAPVNSWTGGNATGFMGFAGHQNTLAASILFTLPGVVAWGKEQRAKGQSSGVFLRLWRISSFVSCVSSNVFRLSSYFSRLSVFILLLASNLILLIITYSRAAIFSLAIGIIAYLIITKSKKILLLSFVIIAITMVLYSTIPFLQSSINSALNKNSNRFLDRRTVLWQPSIEAAKMGAIFGLGYGVSAPGIKTPLKTGSHYEDGRYIREKGNSTLALIEETGVLGLLLFLLPITLLFRKFSLLTANYRLLTATLAALLVHAQFEAWWVGVGSISLPLFLIFLFIALLSEKSLTINQI